MIGCNQYLVFNISFCYNLIRKSTLIGKISVLFALLEKLAEPVHHIRLMLHKGVSIAVEGYGRIFMS